MKENGCAMNNQRLSLATNSAKLTKVHISGEKLHFSEIVCAYDIFLRFIEF